MVVYSSPSPKLSNLSLEHVLLWFRFYDPFRKLSREWNSNKHDLNERTYISVKSTFVTVRKNYVLRTIWGGRSGVRTLSLMSFLEGWISPIQSLEQCNCRVKSKTGNAQLFGNVSRSSTLPYQLGLTFGDWNRDVTSSTQALNPTVGISCGLRHYLTHRLVHFTLPRCFYSKSSLFPIRSFDRYGGQIWCVLCTSIPPSSIELKY